ncbi:hypothetical protein CSC17_3209 [Klebsiella oxytoca]|nr:hypothetical protein CSC17_3209 [Klebsiella oxytoca]
MSYSGMQRQGRRCSCSIQMPLCYLMQTIIYQINNKLILQN